MKISPDFSHFEECFCGLFGNELLTVELLNKNQLFDLLTSQHAHLVILYQFTG